MGVKNFTKALKPFAERRRLGGDGQILHVVIDGPSLAFHIFKICCPIGLASPFHVPSNDVLARTAVAWLDRLVLHGLRVSNIFFDGNLPLVKREVRFKRSITTSQRSSNYFHSTAKGGFLHEPQAPKEHGEELFHKCSPGEDLIASHKNPFAVPAIYHALRQTEQYGPVTQLVAGEADAYCADAVRNLRDGDGMVLSNDSDLLIFDLGPRGSVVKFDDIEPCILPDGAQGVVALSFSPAKISERLALPARYGVSALAFELHSDTLMYNWPLKNKVDKLLDRARRAASIDDAPGKYERFMEPFQTLSLENSELEDIQGLDPRVSELIIQFWGVGSRPDSSSECPGRDPSPGRVGSMPSIFLPGLTDSWLRKSAWEVNAEIRELAFGLLNLGSPVKRHEIREFRRISQVSSGISISLAADGSSLEESCAQLTDLIERIRGGLVAGSGADLVWAVLSLYLDVKRSGEDGPALRMPGGGMIVGDGELRQVVSWDALHFVAQLEAAFYSLRILQQVLGFVARKLPVLPPAVANLAGQLSDLPSLTEFPTIHGLGDLLKRLRGSGGLGVLCAIAELPEPFTFATQVPKKESKKKKIKIERVPIPNQQAASSRMQSTNMFSALQDQ